MYVVKLVYAESKYHSFWHITDIVLEARRELNCVAGPALTETPCAKQEY